MNRNIEELISKERLSGYLGATNNTTEAKIQRYNYNIELCQSLYPVLHILEIALRNTVHQALADHLKDNDWPVNYKKYDIFQERELENLEKAHKKVLKAKKPIETGRVIAELSFGFWVSLFDKHYMQIQMKIINNEFPFASKRQKNITNIRNELRDFKKLRNRVFHYEPIWHWKDLEQKYERMHLMIGWISSDLGLKVLARSKSKFEDLMKRQSLMLK